MARRKKTWEKPTADKSESEKKETPPRAEKEEPRFRAGVACAECGGVMSVTHTEIVSTDGPADMRYPHFMRRVKAMRTRVRRYVCRDCGRSVKHAADEPTSL